MHDEQIKITHENGRSNLDELWSSSHVQTKRKKEGAWDFCQGCTIWCYFETSFLWPPDKYFFLNMKSKGRWAKEKIKQYVDSKMPGKIARSLPGTSEKVLSKAASNPLSKLNETIATPLLSEFDDPTQVTMGEDVVIVEKISETVRGTSR